MKLGEAIPKYQAYRNQLHDNQSMREQNRRR